MYNVYRHYQDGTILFVGTTDDPTTFIKRKRRTVAGFLVIEPVN